MWEKRLILTIFILTIFIIGNNSCFAAGTMPFPTAGEITSPFGYRTHPIFGTQRPHTGIDIGADEGQLVQTVAGGTVILADWNGGYGKCVIIDHGDGTSSLYAHNSEILVTEGQVIPAGTVISQVGSTGYSTGPHLHFEIRVNGVPVNPMDYLDGSRVMPDSPMITIGPDGKPTFANSDFDEVSWSYDSYFDFAKPLRDAINTFSKYCTSGIKLIQDEVKWLFFALITIDLALSAMWNLFDPEGEEVFNWLFKRFLKYGFILFLITHWGDIIANSLKDYFVYMGAYATGTTADTAGKLLSDPSFIVQKGAYIIGPIFTYIMNYSGYKIIYGLPLVIVALVLAMGILACFVYIGFMIMMAYLEFYIIAALSVVSMGFGGLKHTKFLGEKGLGALVQVSLKLLLFSFLAVIMSETVKDYESVPYDLLLYLKILLGSIFFVIMGSRLTKTFRILLGGAGPKL